MDDITDTIRGAVLDAVKARVRHRKPCVSRLIGQTAPPCLTDLATDTAKALRDRLLSSWAGLGRALHLLMTCHLMLPGVRRGAPRPRLEGGAASRDAASAASQPYVRPADE